MIKRKIPAISGSAYIMRRTHENLIALFRPSMRGLLPCAASTYAAANHRTG